jgi:prolyl-tRNA synthetase
MRRSQYFLPTHKEEPKEAEIASHRFMLRAGMIQQNGAGIYTWLPLGLRVLRKIEKLVRYHQDQAGANECLMPTIQPADLWKESGRYDAYGKEMLRVIDRHDREMLYGPTNEEMITDVFRSHIKSYKDLPKNLYHIQWKFRDEIRPRFGVMRGREFLMKDAYSFDLTKEDAVYSYQRMFLAYLKTYASLGLRVIPMKADTGPIGGDLSHEFILLAETGESEVFVDKKWMEMDISGKDVFYDNRAQVGSYFKEMTSVYAATDEVHDGVNAPHDLVQTRGVEVGHIFYFGTKYSEAMNAKVQGKDGKPVPVEMGSYGIGVSRLVGAIIEANHDEVGIKWPAKVAPFDIGLINLKVSDEATTKACDALYEKLETAGLEVLYDDRDSSAGGKFADMDLIGLPWQLIVGPKGLEKGIVELKRRETGEKNEITLDSLVETLTRKLSELKQGF